MGSVLERREDRSGDTHELNADSEDQGSRLDLLYICDLGKLAARCLTQRCTIRRAVSADQHAQGKLTETWELTADVREFAVGQEFPMLVEVTYWNAFDTTEKQWYSTYSNSQKEPENVSVLLLFPENKPFRDSTRLAYPHGSKSGQPFQGNERVITGDANQSLYWEVFSAQQNEAYEVRWTF